jgi:hypothetical protein
LLGDEVRVLLRVRSGLRRSLFLGPPSAQVDEWVVLRSNAWLVDREAGLLVTPAGVPVPESVLQEVMAEFMLVSVVVEGPYVEKAAWGGCRRLRGMSPSDIFMAVVEM